DFGMWQLRELTLPAIVMSRAIIPMTPIRRLELDGTESISNRVRGSPDENCRCVVPYYLPDIEDPAESTYLLCAVVDPSPASSARTMNSTIHDYPSPWFGGSPAIEGGTIEHRDQVWISIGISARLWDAERTRCRMY